MNNIFASLWYDDFAQKTFAERTGYMENRAPGGSAGVTHRRVSGKSRRETGWFQVKRRVGARWPVVWIPGESELNRTVFPFLFIVRKKNIL
ncbi:hypothetical protein [Desulfococcus multivorans]|jgi:hypothetical protein|uniref:hypothetical protein n=1 Tax=Desulfococcus multivorans TaxID=897 RepID=UPI000421AFEF|nr:hypothetical protein [Desulfococcus multivorans]AOY57632.1 uncharacterized protein Dmul_08570 [Desulfococcus multivorans]AQV00039.1 hypothetical protein B2D07_04120 [Desulfococcus multivorans]